MSELLFLVSDHFIICIRCIFVCDLQLANNKILQKFSTKVPQYYSNYSISHGDFGPSCL